MTLKSTIVIASLCAGLMAGCIEEAPMASHDDAGMPRLAGEPATVAQLGSSLARKGLMMQAIPEDRAAAIARFCGGGAEALVLSSDMTDAEVDACSAAGGHWSAVSSNGLPTYLKPSFASNFDVFSS